MGFRGNDLPEPVGVAVTLMVMRAVPLGVWNFKAADPRDCLSRLWPRG
jgi:hypothetical protein